MAENNTAEAQEPIKKAKAYKVTSKAFTKGREAAGEVAILGRGESHAPLFLCLKINFKILRNMY